MEKKINVCIDWCDWSIMTTSELPTRKIAPLPCNKQEFGSKAKQNSYKGLDRMAGNY